MNIFEMGRFTATSFNGRKFEFILTSDDMLHLPEYSEESYKRLIIKPRFLLMGEKCDLKIGSKDPKDLIQSYDIDDKLLDYMYYNGIVNFSSDMSYLYDFKIKQGYDSYQLNGKPFKWASKKGKVLQKQKEGKFN